MNWKYPKDAPYGGGTLDDLELRLMFRNLTNGEATAFIETGTYYGYTTTWVAKQCQIPVFTCEIVQEYIDEAKKVLPSRVELYEESSVRFIAAIKNKVGTLPFFFLDAHWFPKWPLLGELKMISDLFPGAIILIHDMQVPNREHVWFEPKTKHNQALTSEYVRQGLGDHKYTAYFPQYRPCRRGYCILYQGVEPQEVPNETLFIRHEIE